ncbi:MAG: lipopolysaccharide biosynthesis protein [Bacteroidaceae bacterium]|nr:lipopolysaccharide biosynthesis protein [Bacteroidaceae bacterium]
MSLSKQIANNVLWKYLELVSVSGIQLLSTFIMAPLLTPEDYGIIAMVIVFSTLANVLIDSGFGQAIIREKDVTRLDYSTILYFNVVVSLLIYAILYFSTGLIANFYSDPKLNEICKVTFLVLPLNALSLVQITKMQKELRFKRLCIVSFLASILSSIVAIYLAYRYRNVWALVIQNLLTYFLRMLFLWITTDFIPLLSFSISSLKKYFIFSKNILFSSIIGVFFNNIYSLLIGSVYSTADLGFYNQAERIKNLGSQTTTQVIQSVTYPVLAKINNETGDIKNGYKKIISITLLFVGFIMALLMGCSMDLFEIIMGGSPIWRVSGLYFLLIGINGILYPLHCVNQNILMVKGDSKTVLLLEIMRRSIMIIILLVTVNFDIKIFVFGLTFYSVLLLFLNLYYCGRPINYSLAEQLKDVSPILLRLMMMVAASLLVGWMSSDTPTIVSLLLSLMTGLISGIILFCKQPAFQLVLNMLKSYINK